MERKSKHEVLSLTINCAGPIEDNRRTVNILMFSRCGLRYFMAKQLAIMAFKLAVRSKYKNSHLDKMKSEIDRGVIVSRRESIDNAFTIAGVGK